LRIFNSKENVMKRIVLFLALSLLVPFAALAQTNPGLDPKTLQTGVGLLAQCKLFLAPGNYTTQEDAMAGSYCAGQVHGTMTILRAFGLTTPLPELTTSQLAEVVQQYLLDNPTQLNTDAIVLIQSALMAAYPPTVESLKPVRNSSLCKPPAAPVKP
jgi:Rap1a immunity proteins